MSWYSALEKTSHPKIISYFLLAINFVEKSSVLPGFEPMIFGSDTLILATPLHHCQQQINSATPIGTTDNITNARNSIKPKHSNTIKPKHCNIATETSTGIRIAATPPPTTTTATSSTTTATRAGTTQLSPSLVSKGN